MVSSNINTSRIIHEANSNDAQSHHLDLSNEYITATNGGGIQIVNYMPNEMLHHQIQGIKKLDATNYMQSKDQNHIMHVYAGDASSTIITSSSSSLPMLTPLKYVEYINPVTEEQMIITNDDSEKSDCESINELHKTPLKHVKRNLPHKKRIARKLNANQNYSQQEQFSIIMPAEETTMRNIQPSNVINKSEICSVSNKTLLF